MATSLLVVVKYACESKMVVKAPEIGPQRPPHFTYMTIWGFPAHHGGIPIAGWFTMENPFKSDDVGVPLV